MILKKKDSVDGQLMQIEEALKANIQKWERTRLEKNRALIMAGAAGEKEAAFHIDFYLKDSPDYAVIHDLRLEWNGRVAQIDHLVMDRRLTVYVIESKSFKTKVRFANGGWERLIGSYWEGIPSPVEQNLRHIAVLKDLIKDQGLEPSRDIPNSIKYENVILFDPSCSIVGQVPAEAHIYRMDSFVRTIEDWQTWESFKAMKAISSETLMSFASKLTSNHRPLENAITYPADFKSQTPKNKKVAAPVVVKMPVKEKKDATIEFSPECDNCGAVLSDSEISFCEYHVAKFNGKKLCMKCQSIIPPLPKKPHICVECGKEVSPAEAKYCKVKSTEFGGMLFCQKCQGQNHATMML